MKTRKTGKKRQEGLAYMHKGAEQQQHTGETHKGNYLRQGEEEREEVNTDVMKEDRTINIKQEMNQTKKNIKTLT